MCGIADIGRAVLAAAARADKQIVVNPRGDELAAVTLDAVVRRARVDLPVDEGRKARVSMENTVCDASYHEISTAPSQTVVEKYSGFTV